MMFIEEKKLKEAFWSKYKYRSNILRYQFESPIRHGGIDLVTVERVKYDRSELGESIQVNTFEFKLSDVKKVLAQAEENLAYAHKSWVVMPLEKTKIITDRYMDYLKQKKYIGVLGVELDGRWTIVVQPWTQPDSHLTYNQNVVRLMLGLV